MSEVLSSSADPTLGRIPASHRGSGPRPRKAVVVLVVAIVGLAVGLSTVAAASRLTWTAHLGTAGTYGLVSLTKAGTGSVAYRVTASVRHLRPHMTYSVTDRRGSCSLRGSQITTPLLSLTTDGAGAASRSVAITNVKGEAITSALTEGSVALRVGTHCGYLRGPSVPTPTPTPTPVPTFAPGAGVPVVVPGVATIIVVAAEPWINASNPADPGTTLDTIEVRCSGDFSACGPEDFALRDANETNHPAVSPGRQPALTTVAPGAVGVARGWLTFAVPTEIAEDVTLVWTVDGVEHLVPLRLPVPPATALTLTLATTTGLGDARISGAVGTPGHYVAVGWTGDGGNSTPWIPRAWTSTDGLAWTTRSLPNTAGGRANAVALGTSGRLVAVGTITMSGRDHTAIWTSADDGATWTRLTGSSTDAFAGGRWQSLTAFGSGFAVVGSVPPNLQADPHAAAMVSADGLHWARSVPVGGASDKFMSGVIAGGPGLIAWGGTGADNTPESLDAEVWTSATGATWTLSPAAPGWHDPDTGGATSRRMEIIFGASGAYTGIATWNDPDGTPLVYASPDGTAWTPLDVGASLRAFRPEAAIARGGDWLLGGFSQIESGSGAYRHSAWLGDGGTWAPVDVPPPAGADGPADFVEVSAFANGPAGTIAMGTWSTFLTPVAQRGVVWTVPSS